MLYSSVQAIPLKKVYNIYFLNNISSSILEVSYPKQHVFGKVERVLLSKYQQFNFRSFISKIILIQYIG
jgi:hypothetical protein